MTQSSSTTIVDAVAGKIGEYFTGRDGAWPQAPLGDRVLMAIAEDSRYGTRAERVAKRLRVPAFRLRKPLQGLVNQGWATVWHRDDTPGPSSIYELVEDRPGWAEIRHFFYLEYGFVRGENWSRRKHVQEISDETLLDALAHTPAGTGDVDAREYRVLRAQAVKAISRASGIWDAAQGINSEFNERGRDFVHLPPELGPGLPPANPVHARVTTDLLILAIRCREIARDAAGKYRFLARANRFATQRVDAMSTALGGGRRALDGLRCPEPAMEGDVLRAGIVAAMASEALSDQAQYASIDLHGLGGDLMVAWKYRTAAEGLEDVVMQIVGLPQVEPAAMSEQGQVLLGGAADLSVPEVVRPEYGRLDHAAPERAVSELGERVDGVEPGDLRAGDRIVGAGGADLSVAVDVVTDATSESVELAAESRHACFKMPVGLLDYYRGLSVRRPLDGPDTGV